jgi:protein ImuA
MVASLLRIPINDTSDAAERQAPPSVAQLAAQSPHLWRADQLGSWQSAAVATGHGMLDRELPNGGWPMAALVELMLQQQGIGEMRLLQPAFSRIARHRPIVLVQPPYLPQSAAWGSWQLPAEQLLWIRTDRTVDALWAAEQILRNGSCGALLLWQTHVRHEALRRLHLAAQASNMLFWLMRPLAAAQDASPSPLRLRLKPAVGGIDVEILKRRGPQREGSLFLPLGFAPALRSMSRGSQYAPVDRRTPAVVVARSVSPALV